MSFGGIPYTHKNLGDLASGRSDFVVDDSDGDGYEFDDGECCWLYTKFRGWIACLRSGVAAGCDNELIYHRSVNSAGQLVPITVPSLEINYSIMFTCKCEWCQKEPHRFVHLTDCESTLVDQFDPFDTNRRPPTERKVKKFAFEEKKKTGNICAEDSEDETTDEDEEEDDQTEDEINCTAVKKKDCHIIIPVADLGSALGFGSDQEPLVWTYGQEGNEYIDAAIGECEDASNAAAEADSASTGLPAIGQGEDESPINQATIACLGNQLCCGGDPGYAASVGVMQILMKAMEGLDVPGRFTTELTPPDCGTSA